MLGIGKMGLLSLLLGRMFYMQFIKTDEYKTLSDKNRITFIVSPPARGKIYDSDNVVIASNKPCFRLLLDKGGGKKYLDEVYLIKDLLALSEEDIKVILARIKRAASRAPVTIMDGLVWEQIALIEENKMRLSSVFVDMGHSRHYPFDTVTAGLIGYTGQFTKEEKEEQGLTNVGEFNIGKVGLEKYYEPQLRGEFGYRQIEVNAYGKYVRELSTIESVPGHDLYTNIDVAVQEKIYPYLNRQGCSVVLMDIETGAVKVLASTPGFGANNFTKLSSDYWNSLVSDPYKPLINKPVQNSYPPGSVFKIVTVLAAIEAGISPDRIVTCNGGPMLGGNAFRCSAKHGHGPLDMFDAIKYSCNIYMYELGRLIGADKILETAARFGFGKATGIDLPGEASGFLPSRSWKKKRFKSDWSLGDTFNLTIGQGFLLATPLQMARFAAGIASGGKLCVPRILAGNDAAFEQVNINLQHLEVLREGMRRAANTPGGTSYHSRILYRNYELAGKTGTAQVQAKTHADHDLSSEVVAWDRRNHAVFIGFGPYDRPRYSAAVFVDHGGGGGRAAAPIASRVMMEVLDKYGA